MVKVTTESRTVYIIDHENKLIKRIPAPGTEGISAIKGFVNIGEFQPYDSVGDINLGKSLIVIYPHEHSWSISTPIKEIEDNYQEE